MGIEVVISGMTVANPIAVIPPAITGLVNWTYFGNMFPTDNTNLVPTGAPNTNIGSGPQSLASNYGVMWYNAAISSGWRRNNDGGQGPFTLVGVGRFHVSTPSSQIASFIGDNLVYISQTQIDATNSNQPDFASARNGVRSNPIVIPNTTTFRAVAVTEPAFNVAGTAFTYDLTAGTQASSAVTGIAASPGTFTCFGTTTAFGSGSVVTDIAFGAIIQGQQLTLAQLQAQVMPALRSMMTLRGITV